MRSAARSGARACARCTCPSPPCALMTRALDWLPFYPLSTDQLIMLEEESVTDPSRFFTELRLQPEPLAAGLKRLFAAP